MCMVHCTWKENDEKKYISFFIVSILVSLHSFFLSLLESVSFFLYILLISCWATITVNHYSASTAHVGYHSVYFLQWKFSPLLGQVYRPRFWRVSPGRVRPFTAYIVGPIWPRWGSLSGDMVWPGIHSLDVVLLQKTDGELGRDEDVCHEDSASSRIAQQPRVGERHVPFRMFKLSLRMTISVRSSSAMTPPPPNHETPSASLPHFYDKLRHRRMGPAPSGGGGGWGPCLDFFDKPLFSRTVIFAFLD